MRLFASRHTADRHPFVHTGTRRSGTVAGSRAGAIELIAGAASTEHFYVARLGRGLRASLCAAIGHMRRKKTLDVGTGPLISLRCVN